MLLLMFSPKRVCAAEQGTEFIRLNAAAFIKLSAFPMRCLY